MTAPGPVSVVSVDPATDPSWEALLGLPGAGLFHSPPWISAIRDAYGFVPRAEVVIDSSGTPLGGVAYCLVDDVLGARLVSLPFSDACDPLLGDPRAWPAIRTSLATHCLPVTLRSRLASCLDDDPEVSVTKRARWHTLSVEGPDGSARARFAGATRRALDKAERAGITLRPLDGLDELAGFLHLHAQLRKRKYRMLAQPEQFFTAIERQFRAVDGWYPLGAWHGDRLLAATIYLRRGDTLYYKFNASDPQALEMRPNNLLIWGGIELARSLGCTALDLGPSDDDQPGLIRFKRGFGACEGEVRFLQFMPPGCQTRSSDELRDVLGEVTRLLTSPAMPDDVTTQAGAAMYRVFA